MKKVLYQSIEKIRSKYHVRTKFSVRFASIFILLLILFSSFQARSSPYQVSTEIGKQIVIKSYDMNLNEVAEFSENIIIGPTYTQLRDNAISKYENPKLEFLSDKPFNIINEETIVYENIASNSISELNLQQFISGSNETTKKVDISLNNISVEGRSQENLVFDGMTDTKFIWLDQNKIWSDVDGGTSSLSIFKKRINYTMEVFDVESNLGNTIQINWFNFPARLIVDEADTTAYNFELRWRGSAIRDKFHYQVFHYSQYPQDDQSTIPAIYKIFVLRFDIDFYTFDSFLFDFDAKINPESYPTVVFSSDGSKILLAPWIEGRTLEAGETPVNKFSEDQVSFVIDIELNNITPYTLFRAGDNSQIGIRFLTLSESNIIFVKNEEELISYDLSNSNAGVLISDIASKLGRDGSATFRGRNTGSIYLVKNHFIVMNAESIFETHMEGTGEVSFLYTPQNMVLLAIIALVTTKRINRSSQTQFQRKS